MTSGDYSTQELLLKGNNLGDLASAATARTNLGLGSAATQASTAFDPAGAAAAAQAAAQAASQPLDSDLTAIAALSTTTFGRSLLALADAAAGRTALGLGSAATQPSSAFDTAGAASAAQAASQPLDSDLTAIAALSTTSYGRAFLALADAAAAQAALGLGSAATQPSSAFEVAGAASAEAGSRATADSAILAVYRSILDRDHRFDAQAAGTYYLLPDSTSAIVASNGVAGRTVFYLDPADWAIAGKTTKLRLRGVVLVNATSPAADFTFGLYPVSAVAGAAATVSITAGAVQSGSAVPFTAANGNQPTASQMLHGEAEFTCPSAGFYALGLVIGGAMAANSSIVARAQMGVRNV